MNPIVVFGGAVVTTVGAIISCCGRVRSRAAQLFNRPVQQCPYAAQPWVAPQQQEVDPPQPEVPPPEVPPQPAPIITSVVPAMGTTGGATRVKITGTNFTPGQLTVRFGAAIANVVDATELLIVIDTPVHLAGAVDVRVTNNDEQFHVATRAFSYMIPEVTAIDPAAGPLSGGNQVGITGRFFGPNVNVQIAGRPAGGVHRLDEQTVVANVPARQAPVPIDQGLNVDVINTHDSARGRLNAAYKYVPLRITSVNPAFDASAGGAELTITGTGFDAGTTVTIGGFAVGNLALVSPTRITCTAPALPTHGAALCDVVATSGAAGYAQADTLADGFTYIAPTTLVAVAPARGRREGGAQVKLLGMGFSAQTAVYFKDKKVDAVFVSSGELHASPPQLDHPNNMAHAVRVAAHSPSNPKSELVDGYTYEADEPAVHVVLYPATHDFNSILAHGGNDANLANQLLQMHNTGTLDARDGNSAGQQPGRTYHNHIAGGSGGLLFCRHAHARHTIYQVLDVTLHRPDNNYSSSDLLKNKTKNRMWHATAGYTNDAITKHDAEMAKNFAAPGAVPLAIQNSFTLLAVEPNTGATANCDQVTLHGRFIPADIRVTFGGEVADLVWADANTITATPPAHAAGAVAVRVIENPNGHAIFVELAGAFVYQAFALAALTPASGSHDGENSVVITGSGFNAGTTVSFGAVAVNPADLTIHSSSVITAVAPAQAAAVVNVDVIVNGVTLTLPYQYVQ